MKQLSVESKKSMFYGFVLREADLRRLVDLCRDRVQRVLPDGGIVEKYSIKFRNGAIAETESIDDVLTQENSGGAFLIRVKAELSASNNGNKYYISVEFINADEDDEPGLISIRYTVRAPDRDWVFVTSSEIGERIERTRRFAPNQLGHRRRRFMPPIIAMAAVIVTMSIGFVMVFLTKQEFQAGSELATWVEDNNVTNPIDVIVKSEEIRNRIPDATPLIAFFGGSLGVVILMMLIFLFFVKYYPVFNFVWGDYVDEFDRLERARRFWILTILGGVIVSVIGGIVANSLQVF